MIRTLTKPQPEAVTHEGVTHQVEAKVKARFFGLEAEVRKLKDL